MCEHGSCVVLLNKKKRKVSSLSTIKYKLRDYGWLTKKGYCWKMFLDN